MPEAFMRVTRGKSVSDPSFSPSHFCPRTQRRAEEKKALPMVWTDGSFFICARKSGHLTLLLSSDPDISYLYNEQAHYSLEYTFSLKKRVRSTVHVLEFCPLVPAMELILISDGPHRTGLTFPPAYDHT